MQKCVNKCTYITLRERQKYNKIKLNLIIQSNRTPTNYSLRFAFFYRPFDLEQMSAN